MPSRASGSVVSTSVDAAAWRDRLVELMQRHRVPGATLGILHDGAITEASAAS